MKRLNELMIRMGFVCVGYTFAIDVRGNIFSGRPLNQVGGHTRGLNTTRHAVALIGNFSSKRPPAAMEAAIVDLYEHGQRRNWWRSSFTGHRDHGSTACPGGAAYGRLSAYRSGSVGSGSGGSGSSGNAESSSDTAILRRGSSGAAVARWQRDLRRWNSSALPRFGADGDFGAETEDWTRRFQRAAGIGVDGVVGPQSRRAMEAALAPAPSPSPSPSPSHNARSMADTVILRRGSTGAAVTRWQRDLRDWNSSALPRFGADGDFGAETEDWTRRFQRAAGISVDGVVGPQSRRAMEDALTRDGSSPERKYQMLVYARRDTADSLSAYTVLSQHNVFAVFTHSRGEALEALKRGEDVVAVGGPAADDLPSGAVKVVGNDRGDTLRKFMDWADENL